ncbi:MAG TPA: Crp/Fnr family transcriptional regulator [Hyphomicrobiaceae bacterium]|nr:Crp/Fnr family transcriptional regulator [Hyphomicrobiaceae bacterium]
MSSGPSEATVGHDRTRTLLKNGTFLGGLPDAALDLLARRVHVAKFAKGATIYTRGDAGDSMMIIVTGRVKITNVTADAHEVVLNFLGKGDVLGEIALLDGRERTAGAVTLEATEVLVLQRRDALPVLTAHPDTLLEVIMVLCEKLRLASGIIESHTLDMAGRTASGLLRLVRQHGRQSKGGALIDLKLSQRDLGNYLGLSRENVNRQLAALREKGVISVDGANITIVDEDALTAIAEHDGEDVGLKPRA